MSVKDVSTEDVLKRYSDLRVKNTPVVANPKEESDRAKVKKFVRALIDLELNTEEFKQKGQVLVMPSNLGESIYDDWGTLTGDKAVTRAARVKSLATKIEEYVKEKGYTSKVVSGGKGRKTVLAIYKEAPEEAEPEADETAESEADPKEETAAPDEATPTTKKTAKKK